MPPPSALDLLDKFAFKEPGMPPPQEKGHKTAPPKVVTVRKASDNRLTKDKSEDKFADLLSSMRAMKAKDSTAPPRYVQPVAVLAEPPKYKGSFIKTPSSLPQSVAQPPTTPVKTAQLSLPLAAAHKPADFGHLYQVKDAFPNADGSSYKAGDNVAKGDVHKSPSNGIIHKSPSNGIIPKSPNGIVPKLNGIVPKLNGIVPKLNGNVAKSNGLVVQSKLPSTGYPADLGQTQSVESFLEEAHEQVKAPQTAQVGRLTKQPKTPTTCRISASTKKQILVQEALEREDDLNGLGTKAPSIATPSAGAASVADASVADASVAAASVAAASVAAASIAAASVADASVVDASVAAAPVAAAPVAAASVADASVASNIDQGMKRLEEIWEAMQAICDGDNDTATGNDSEKDNEILPTATCNEELPPNNMGSFDEFDKTFTSSTRPTVDSLVTAATDSTDKDVIITDLQTQLDDIRPKMKEKEDIIADLLARLDEERLETQEQFELSKESYYNIQSQLKDKIAEVARLQKIQAQTDEIASSKQALIESELTLTQFRNAAHLVVAERNMMPGTKLPKTVLGCYECWTNNLTCDNMATCKNCVATNTKCLRWRCSQQHILKQLCPDYPGCFVRHSRDGWLVAESGRPEW